MRVLVALPDTNNCIRCERPLFVDGKACVMRLTGRSWDINAGRASNARFAEVVSLFCSPECEASDG